MGVDHGGGGEDKSPPRIWSGGIVPLRCCHVAKFHAPDYLHYNVGKCVFCLYSRTFIVSPAMRPPKKKFQSDLRLWRGDV